MFLLLNALLLVQEGEPAPAKGPAGLFDSFLVPMLLVLVVFWVVMIGPERKNRKKREELLKAVGKGDKVMMQGGIYGTVVQVQDDVLTVQIADGVRVRFARSALQSRLDEDGTPLGEKKDGKGAKKDGASKG